MKIAYLTNQYPKVSHAFIRREIHALESIGFDVSRYSVRSCEAELIDTDDKAEFAKTTVLLRRGLAGLVMPVLALLVTRPHRLIGGVWAAVRHGRRSDRGVLRYLVYLAEAAKLVGLLARDNVEHLHAHFGTNSTDVAMLCRILGGPPYSFTVHGPEEFDRATVLALGEKISRAKFVAGVSEFGRSQLYRWSDHADWDRIHVVHCGVDEKFLRSKPEAVPDTPRLVCVGRLCEQKGQLHLMRAAAQLRDMEIDFEIVLAGDGPMRDQVEQVIGELDLGGHVRITGWLTSDEVRRELLSARALVLPSFAEGLPVVIMEALALGRPVITTYIAGIPELVEDGVNGWLAPAGAIGPLVDAMQRALDASPDLLDCMGAAGANAVARKHDASIEAARLGRLIRSAGGPARSNARVTPSPADSPVLTTASSV